MFDNQLFPKLSTPVVRSNLGIPSVSSDRIGISPSFAWLDGGCRAHANKCGQCCNTMAANMHYLCVAHDSRAITCQDMPYDVWRSCEATGRCFWPFADDAAS